MTDREYFDRLARLTAEGMERDDEGKRTSGVRTRIEDFVAANESRAHRSLRIFAERLAQGLACAGYVTAAALGVLALTMSVECVVGGLPARMWLVYAGGALAALLLGILAHALYDGNN